MRSGSTHISWNGRIFRQTSKTTTVPSCGYCPRFEGSELELLAKMEHKRWMAERFLAGWTLGPRDDEKRINPYLVEWEDLPPNIQDYDRNFVRILPNVLKQVNLEIRR